MADHITSEEVLKRGGGTTDEQTHQAQEFIKRMTDKYADFKMALNDVLVMHVTHNLTFEQIESYVTELTEKEEKMTQVQRYNYLLIRKDLPVAQQLVQAAHAAHESGLHLCEDKSKVNYLVALEVIDEDRLLEAHERLQDRGVESILFREPDRNNEATALCTEPIRGNSRKMFSKYSLWREAK